MAEINGNDSSETLNGTDDADIINGLGGNDRIITGNGADTVYGGEGNDEINGFITGENSWSVYPSSGPLIVYGGNGDDVIIGSPAKDLLEGEAGNDFIVGDQGDDEIDGGPGDDRIYGGNGNNTLIGGAGNDFINLTGQSGANLISGDFGNDEIYGALGNDVIFGGSGNDTLFGLEGDDKIEGGAGDDEIHGGEGDNEIFGGDGDDYLQAFGSSGSNILDGGNGDDELYGGSGNDVLAGGSGFDLLWGYEGDDTYIIASRTFHLWDSAGQDSVIVEEDFVKIPSTIENVSYANGALPLPYWIDALLFDDSARYSSYVEEDRVIYFGFPDEIPDYDENSDDAFGYTPFNDDQQSFTRSVFAYLGSVLGIDFDETASYNRANVITLANNQQFSSAGYASYPSDDAQGSDLFLDVGTQGNLDPKNGEFAALTLIHELGHALGLKHPFDYEDASNEVANPPYLQDDEENTNWTVMSYNSSPEDYRAELKELDIAALQYLYGPDPDARAGNNVYSLAESGPNFIWDGNGIDTLDASASSQQATLFLEPGHWGFFGAARALQITANGQVTVNFGTIIENLEGTSYADQLHGNAAGNIIKGHDGDDSLTGNGGDDNLNGGDGLDKANYSGILSQYEIINTSSILSVADTQGDEGTDTLSDIERLQFDDRGLAFDIDGDAGIVAKLLGAVLGPNWFNPEYNGIGLYFLETFGYTFEEIMQIALDTVLGEDASNEDVFNLFYSNLVGQAPPQELLDEYVGQLDSGALTPAGLGVAAANYELNLSNINLVGLSTTGLEFIPFLG